MLSFRPITLHDREEINPILRAYDSKSCDYSFANNFVWAGNYQTQFAVSDGFYCMRSGKTPNLYSNPVGSGDYGTIIKKLAEDAGKRRGNFTIRGLLKQDVEAINTLFPGRFTIIENRNEFDYIYSVEALTNLTGKKYAGKRNHIARFLDNPDWAYEPITEKNMPECMEMNEEWCRRNGCTQSRDLRQESCAVFRFMHYFKRLELSGGLLRRNGKVVAFTIGEPISHDTYNIHVEKAFSDIQGAYPMINRQFLIHNCEGYRYVNREEDTGDEGLRRAKLSYHPEILLEKYTAVLKKGAVL